MSNVVTFVLGTRPEIIKLSPVIRACEERGVDFSLIHTGQHYSRELDKVFFDQLGLPTPHYDLEVGSKEHGPQTGEMIAELDPLLRRIDPDVVLVQGDTNSVLAGAITTCKLDDVQLGHVEAGLRSYDRGMPEEHNRRVTDHVSDYLFTPTEDARANLLAEDLDQNRITVTGNTIVDAVHENVKLARSRSTVLDDLELGDDFALLTAHRAENVDDRGRFSSLLQGASGVAREHGFRVVYPIHPRSRKQLVTFDIHVPQEIQVIEPLDFLDFLRLEDEASVVLTDSGGVQEECCILGTPCVTLRDSTERPETVDVGANLVVGVRPDAIQEAVDQMLRTEPTWENPFGDGRATEQILEVLPIDEL